MKRNFTILFILSFFVTFTLSSQTVKEIALQQSTADNFEVINETNQGFEITNSISSLKLIEEKTKGGTFFQLEVNGLIKTFGEGSPNIPVISKLIEIPYDAKVKFNIISYDEEIIELADRGIKDKIMPAQPSLSKSDDADKVPFYFDEDAYKIDKFTNTETAVFEYSGEMRGTRLGRIEISPVQYNPVKNVLKVLNNLIVEVVFENADYSKTIEVKNKYYSTYFEDILNHSTINKLQTKDKALITDEPLKYVIVSDPMFETALQPFIEWKIKKGFNVIEAYTDDAAVGTTTTTIKAYLQDLYENPGAEPAPSFVLLVGDVAQIPAFTGTAGGGSQATDLFYCEYTDDHIPEVFYGRFSANNVTELQPQIDKTLELEQYTMPGTAYLSDVVLVAGVDDYHAPTWGNGQINYCNDYYTNAGNGITSYFYLYGDDSGVMASEDAGASASIISRVSTGVTFGNYTAHCGSTGWSDPSFKISDIAGLANEHKYPLLIGNCCSSVTFEGTCFGEEILRAANKGAVGYIGGSNSTTWDEDYWWGVGVAAISANPTYEESGLGVYDRSFHMNGEDKVEWYITQGQMVSGGNLAVEASTSTGKDYYWEIYHLMGDPSFTPYLSVPNPVTATYNNTLPVGTTSLSVTTEENAYVALTENGILLDAKIADASGSVTLTFSALTTPGTDILDIVVTKQDRAPHIEKLTVFVPSGPYLSLDGYTIDDATGNINGLADFSETVNLDITLKNVGSETANNVTATLTTTDSYVVSLTNATSVAYGSIIVDAIQTSTGNFTVEIANNISDQYTIDFDIAMADDSKADYNSNISLNVNAPALSIGEMLVDDSGTGNNDGILDPGETANILIKTANVGHADVTNVIGALEILGGTSPYLTINTASSTLGTLVADGDTLLATFSVTADAGTSPGTHVDLVYTVTAGVANQYTADENKQVIIGEIPIYLISDEGTHAVHTGLFYDSGGESGNYADDEDYTITFTPAIAGYYIKLNFLSFNTELCCDHLYIYDGTTTEATLIGKYNSGNPPSEIIATNDDGAITCYFHSDYSVDKYGWEAEISLEPPKFDVTFSVTDGTDPILEAEVEFEETNQSTDIDGLTIFTEIPIGNDLPYIVSRYGFSQVTGTVNVIDTDVIENIVMVALPSYDVTFIVTDGTDPIEGAEITTIIDSVKTTDINGQAIFYPINGDYTYTVTVNNYDDILSTPYTVNSVALDIPVTMEATIFDYTFTVSDGTNPIEGALVSVGDSTGTTAANGQAVIHLTFGDYNYTVSILGFDDIASTAFTVNYDALSLDVIMNPTVYTASFTVSDGTNTLEGADVIVGSDTVVTNSSGVSTFNLINGNYNYSVLLLNYNDVTSTGFTIENANLNVPVTMIATVFDYTFTVTDGTNPIEGALVTVGDSTATTNSDGEAVLHLTFGNYNYTVSILGFDDIASTAFTVNYDALSLDVTMNPTVYTVTFNVTNGTDTIKAADVIVGTDTVSTDSLGDAVFGLTNGTYTYSVRYLGYDDINNISFTVDNADIAIPVTMNETEYPVTFTVTYETTPIEGAEVIVGDDTLTTNSSGIAVFDLLNGDYNYSITAEGYYDISSTAFTVDLEALSIDVSMEKIIYLVTFTVTDGENALEGADVIVGDDTVVTNSSGVSVFNLINGTYSYSVENAGYYDINDISFTVSDANEDISVTMVLITYEVSFYITDGTELIGGAKVVFNEITQYTDDYTGITTFTDIAPGEDYVATISKDNYHDASETIDVVDSDVDVTVQLIGVGIKEITNKDITIYPNPVINKATISYMLLNNANVDISIFDILGNKILDIVENQEMQKGLSNIEFSTNQINAGIYFVKLNIENKTYIKRIVIE
ncbi:MAG: T9SS type A sorting domain-containing protein [Bacteroidales bacterium]|nr:T9SS type A sorting domain-containing protein [Bacteroidales bacterium]